MYAHEVSFGAQTAFLHQQGIHMVHRIKFLLIFAAVSISSCQAGDRSHRSGTFHELFRRPDVQYVASKASIKDSGYCKEITVTFVNGIVANAMRTRKGKSSSEISSGYNDIYSGYMVYPPTGIRLLFNTTEFFAAAERALEDQEKDLSSRDISRTFFNGSLVHPADLAGARIVRWIKRICSVSHLNGGRSVYSHTNFENPIFRNKTEIFKVKSYSLVLEPVLCTIRRKEFKDILQQYNPEVDYTEKYKAIETNGTVVIASLTRTGHDEFTTKLCKLVPCDEKDENKNNLTWCVMKQDNYKKGDPATFLVMQDAYRRQKERRKSQAVHLKQQKK